MYINHNGMASNVANTLTSHYSNLATSTQRLSSGLRVNSSADDAAGLAIRELMRADISALNQGVRNANDAISMIQTADGALGIIDEKLIRMKELAEQAATGTYDSTQRLMIESEYQQMASEITRIANSTDFNGMKLLDGTLEGTHDGSKMDSTGAMKIHFGTGNDSAEDYYYIEIGEVTAQALGVGNQSTFADVTSRAKEAFSKNLTDNIKDNLAKGNITDAEAGELLSQVGAAADAYEKAINKAIDPQNAHTLWAPATGIDGFMEEGKKLGEANLGNSTVMTDYLSAAATQEAAKDLKTTSNDIKTAIATDAAAEGDTQVATPPTSKAAFEAAGAEILKATKDSAMKNGMEGEALDALMDKLQTAVDGAIAAIDANATPTWDATTFAGVTNAVDTVIKNQDYTSTAQSNVAKQDAINTYMDSLSDPDKEKLRYAWGQAAIYNLANASASSTPASYGINADMADMDFGTSAAGTLINKAGEMLTSALKAGHEKVKDMDVAGHSIQTQEDAQHALEALNDAIVQKDKVRAHLGALQNRLENTVSNLTIQAENLQASESRISDVDVATEMTNFVRNQILTQSAVAMLSQANSMPQMAMQLIG